jgi:hypothetical protein
MTEKEFWNKKYAEGGISGRGSLGIYRNWKWNHITRTIGTDIDSLIDVGCGDLSFWNHPIGNKILKQKNFKYTGIDISDHIIKRNRIRHAEGFKRIYPGMKFVCSPAHEEQPGLRAQVVFALDLLFHIMDNGEFVMILENLCNYANLFLVIYTWKNNPFELQNVVTDGISQYFRNLGDYKHIFSKNDMQLIQGLNVPYDGFGRLYIFKRLIY